MDSTDNHSTEKPNFARSGAAMLAWLQAEVKAQHFIQRFVVFRELLRSVLFSLKHADGEA